MPRDPQLKEMSMGSNAYLDVSLIHSHPANIREDLTSDLERASAAPAGSSR